MPRLTGPLADTYKTCQDGKDCLTEIAESKKEEMDMEENNIESVELEQDELQGVAGGYKNDQETCPHNGGFNYIHKYRNMGPGKNDWGYHLQM